MTILHLVRHGETVWHAENRYAGNTDVPLTARGLAQASNLAAWAATRPIGRVVSSDLSRARKTAKLSASALGLPLETDSRLREIDFGAGEGLTADEMEHRFPAARAAFVRAPASSPLPGGETGTSVATRALAVLRELIADAGHAGNEPEVLVVAHTTLIRLVVCELLRLELDRYRTVFPQIANCAVTTMRIAGSVLGEREPNYGAALLTFNVPTSSA